MRFYVYSILIILYIASNFTSSPVFPFITGMVAIIGLIVSFFHASGMYLYSGFVFLSIGGCLYFSNILKNALPWYHLFLHFDSMLGMLSLFLVLPFINTLIRVGKYDKNLNLLLQKGIKNVSKLYRRSFLVCHLLGLFLNIATIPLLRNSLKKTLQQIPEKSQEKFYTQNLLRAYALCLIWNPLEVMVVTSLDITNTDYFEFFPIIISIVLLFILIDWFLSHFKHSRSVIEIEYIDQIHLVKTYRKIIELILLLLLLVLVVTVVQRFLDLGFLFSMVLVIIPISFLWASFIGIGNRYRKVAVPLWVERTRGLSNYYFMFLSAGFLVGMISKSTFIYNLQTLFVETSDHRLLLYLVIGGYFLVLSLIGFHPLVSLTLLATLLHPLLPSISSVSLAVVLITCSLASVMYSPFNLSVSLLADQLKLNSYRMGIWNILFAISFMVICILIAYQLSFII